MTKPRSTSHLGRLKPIANVRFDAESGLELHTGCALMFTELHNENNHAEQGDGNNDS